MQRSLWRDSLFALNVFASCMLALYIAFAVGLERPYWAMATVFAVANPLFGATRAKGLYRALGTLLGATAAVILVPTLESAPVLLSLALSAWTGICLYIALLDRRPRSYVFLLAGYTAAIIGFPSVDAPGAIWDTAISRAEEIILGIICTTTVHGLIFPSPVAPVLSGRIDRWLHHAGEWTQDLLNGRVGALSHDRRMLAADLIEIGQINAASPYDTSQSTLAGPAFAVLHARMVMLLPVLSAAGDWMVALRATAGAGQTEILALMARVAAWVDRKAGTEAEDLAQLRTALAAAQPNLGPGTTWPAIVAAQILRCLRQMVDLTEDCRRLQAHSASGANGLPKLLLPRDGRLGRSRHRDHGIAALSALSAAVTLLLICAFWIGTAWPDGAVAAEMAAIVCCFFAAQDDPAPAIVVFLIWSMLALLADLVLLFAVLPRVTDFPLLALALAPPVLAAGFMITRPRAALGGVTLGLIMCTLLGLQNGYSGDAASFIGSCIATVMGMLIGAVVTRLIRSVGASWSARRLLRAGWSDLAAMAEESEAADPSRLTGLMLDRLGLLIPRLPAEEAAKIGQHLLRDLRVGLHIATLRQHRAGQPEPLRRLLAEAFAMVATHFRQKLRSDEPVHAPPKLLAILDQATDAAIASPDRPANDRVVLALAGLRLGLFHDAPGFAPACPVKPLPATIMADLDA